MGNTFKITTEQYEEVMAQIETTTDGIITICERVGIEHRTFVRYKNADKERMERYFKTKALQADMLCEQILEVISAAEGERALKDNKKEWGRIKFLEIKVSALFKIIGILSPKYKLGMDVSLSGEVATRVIRLPGKKVEGAEVEMTDRTGEK
jgi:hypothetical protein